MKIEDRPLTILPEDELIPPNDDYPFFEDWSEHPFLSEATGFELVNAWRLAEASLLAYSPSSVIEAAVARAGLDVKFFSGPSTQCYVAHDEEFALLSFRGTEVRGREGGFLNVISDVRADAKALLVSDGGVGAVHQGFCDALDEVWTKRELRPFLDGIRKGPSGQRRLFVTGHSLGAALATLAGARLGEAQGLYTYGSPSVGDATFAGRFPLTQFRLVHDGDIVTRIPLWPYEPVGTLKFIDATGHLHDRVGLLGEIEARLQVALGHLFAAGKPTLEDLAAAISPQALTDHAPLYYVLRCRNLYARTL